MNNTFKDSILITGSTRSGTTYLGRFLAQNKDLIYLWEPFQVGLKEKNNNGVFDYWFEYLENGSLKSEAVLRFLSNYAHLNIHDLKNLRTKKVERIHFELKNIQKKICDGLGFRKYRYILKDPIALYSSEWLFNNIENLKVIVMIRNPVKIIESYKKLKWDIGFIELKRQNKLLQQFPDEFADRVEHCVKENVDIVDKGILFWNLIYHKVLEYKKKYSENWLFVKLEDLQENEAKIMSQIFKYCNVPIDKDFSETLKAKKNNWIYNAASEVNPKVELLTASEREKIMKSTCKIASQFGYFL